MTATLARLEEIIDTSGVSKRIELQLPVGVRPRQLKVRTLLLGMLLIAVQGRPAHLCRVHHALLALAAHEHRRLGIITDWSTGPHLLTYRQTERTFGLVVDALSRDTPDGTPIATLSQILDALLEASVQVLGEPASSSYAVDWTDHETWSNPPPKRNAANPEPATSDPKPAAEPSDTRHDADADADAEHAKPANDNDNDDRQCADPEASWGHRRGNHPGQKDEAFYGYYLQAATTVRDEHGPHVPELARRMHLASCDHDPPAAFVPVLQRMKASGITITDVLADSGYAYRVPETWSLPIRQLGAELIQDLHPNDRGPNSTHMGAICANGRLYCPATPTTLLDIGPLPRAATSEQTTTHDQRTAELARYKLSAITNHDRDGYHRVSCPAAQGKLRCPHKPTSITLPNDRPTVLTPPEHPPVCCTQQTITVPPSVNAKTTQKHDYPSASHRNSYHRRTGAERTFSTIKDPATNDTSRGWCRITGLTGIALLTATVLIARNIRIADAFTARQADNERRAARGLPPKHRRRRRATIHDLATAHAP
jgi:hypothetical protein